MNNINVDIYDNKLTVPGDSSSWDIFNESVNGRTNGRTDKVIAI
jgi:hypothetical protein